MSWLGMRRLEPNLADGQKHLDRFQSEISKRVERGLKEGVELDRTDACRRELTPAD